MENARSPLVCVLDPIAAEATAWLAGHAEVAGPDDPRTADWPTHADGLIVRTSPVPGAAIRSAARLKVIAKHGVGVDNIDLGAARAAGVRVTNTPGANTNATAELTVALVLATARRVASLDRALRDGVGVREADRIGMEVFGRAVGLVGFGRIAQRVAAIVRQGFGCTVRAYSPRTLDERFAAAGVERAASLPALAAVSDILSIHVPLSPETRHLIGRNVLSALPRTAILVNTARGGIVDEIALYEALRSGDLAAAASDVFETEPPPAGHPLLSLPNFIATPHIGAATTDAMRNMGMDAARAAVAILRGGVPEDGLLV
ncbi:MAG TPA: hydroxyacid dehydrogenase [Azospirillaceae bacterium]|nr:hydroxyacid dehydrogenase [Azospirillaceae bacterium]